MPVIYDQYGIKRDIHDLSAVDRLSKLKSASGLNPWPVIEECLKIWSEKNPKKWESYLYYIKDIKETRKEYSLGGKRFKGVTKDKKFDGFISYTVDIPQPVMYMIRCIYTPEELPMNKEFFSDFIRKFPKFAIREAQN